MLRSTRLVIALCTAIGCSATSTESRPTTVTADAFIGAWRSVTPSLEFVRLSVVSKSSEMGAVGARLTLSGLAWDGTARVDGDSLIAAMTVAGTSQSAATIIARLAADRTLRVQMRPATADAVNLTFVRDD